MAQLFNVRLAFAAMALAGLLTGCSTPGYHCPLSDANGDCASMSDAYSASLHAQRGDAEVQTSAASVFTNQKPGKVSSLVSVPAPAAPFTGYPASDARGSPVYDQAQVHRVWSAPWTDATGLLHGGEYVYFTTPGHWRYGGTMAAGQASGIFAPIKPNSYGVPSGAIGATPVAQHRDLARDKISPQSAVGIPLDARTALSTMGN